MDSASKSVRSKNKDSENVNPNLNSKSPIIAKSQKSASRNTNPNNPVICSPQQKIRQRKFVVAKKKPKKDDENSKVSCKCKDKCGKGNPKKCLCVAYESLRASQEEFFKNPKDETADKEIDMSLMIQDLQIGEEENRSEVGSSTVKRRRNKVMEEARKSVPESGSGRVRHLVKAFEKLREIPMPKKLLDEYEEEEENREMKWSLPGIDGHSSSSLFCPSQLILSSDNLGLSVSSSWDSTRQSISSRTSGGRRSRRNSMESSSSTLGRRRWKQKQLKVTSLKPFKLRTEQRGKMKEEDFMRRVHEMMTEEERQRIPIAQGLPWTTDEPEIVVKPPVKDVTRPIDLQLHSDLRAMDRAEFDHQVAEKMSIIEQYKMERERQQKLEEEEEIRRLRKELVPKAQPMPYFDRPFIPRRSMKHPTIPREPKFHIPQHKKIKCLSWNDISSYIN